MPTVKNTPVLGAYIVPIQIPYHAISQEPQLTGEPPSASGFTNTKDRFEHDGLAKLPFVTVGPPAAW